MTMTLRKYLSTAAVALGVLVSNSAFAETVEEFYSGKTINLYIGYSVGGGYDTYARMIAAHIGKHIPGNPTVVPNNMPGAGSLRLTNWLYEAAPADGTAFGAIARAAPFEPLLKNQAANFKASEFNFIGNANREYSLCAANADSGVKNVEDLKSTELLVGGTGAGSDPNIHANVLNEAIGSKMTIVDGYPGGNDIVLAMERGEVQGRCGWSWSTIKATKMDLVNDGKVNLLLQFSSSPHPELLDVPLALDLTDDKTSRGLINFVVATQEMGRPYIAPPGVPEDRVEALREAFAETMSDPEFLQAATAAGLEISPSSGRDLQTIVQSVYQTEESVLNKLIELRK